MTDPDRARLALVEALVATGRGDRAAFRALYDLTAAKLFGVCLRICGERSAAEDVLHEVYITVWKRAEGYEPGRSSPITWLATIARNRAIDWRRAHPADRWRPGDEAPDRADESPLASELLLAEEGQRQLHLCLEALDGPQRDAIRTAFYDGVTYAELAERSAVPLGTMKSWIRRALLRLKECLNGDA